MDVDMTGNYFKSREQMLLHEFKTTVFLCASCNNLKKYYHQMIFLMYLSRFQSTIFVKLDQTGHLLFCTVSIIS